MPNCEFCHKDFKTTYSLSKHQTVAKYCLKIQEKENDEIVIYMCTFCDKDYTSTQNLNNHLLKCYGKKYKEKFEEELNSVVEKYETELTSVKKELNEKDSILKQAENKIIYITEQNLMNRDIIKELQDKLERLAMRAIDKPTNMTSMTNNVNNNNIQLNSFISQEDVNNKITSKFTDKYLHNGMSDIAKFVLNHILTLDDGQVIYTCYDVSRKMFKFKDKDGNIVMDPHALKLIAMVQPGLQLQINTIINYLENAYSTEENEDVIIKTLHEKARDIKIQISEMHITPMFSKELAMLTC